MDQSTNTKSKYDHLCGPFGTPNLSHLLYNVLYLSYPFI